MKHSRMPTAFRRYSRVIGLVIVAALGCQSLLPAAKAKGLGPDTLYVGDASDNTIKSFNADGLSLDGTRGAFITQPSGDLHGPRGLFIAGPELIVVNQNQDQPSLNGEILQYQLKDGSFTGPWVPKTDRDAPFAPRGAVSKNGVLYVANFVENNGGKPGEVLVFAGNGKFLGELAPPAGGSAFRPRGVVVGPDGLLYVSSDPNFAASTGPTTGGQVLRFDPDTLAFVSVFINDAGGVGNLNRPEGLVFGPDGKLYVTSFRATTGDTDSIRIYNGTTGAFLDKIELDQVNQPRAFAQALLFGPLGNLFVPTTTPPTSAGQVPVGQVLSCKVLPPKICSIFVHPGTLGSPFYLTFGRTDPATLAYPHQ
jgi:hypothetical protein